MNLVTSRSSNALFFGFILTSADEQLVLEKGDRPVAGSDPAVSAQLYENFGTGLDVSFDVACCALQHAPRDGVHVLAYETG